MSLVKAAIWLHLTASGTYRSNNLGRRIDPRGTPEVTGKGLAGIDCTGTILAMFSRFPPKT